MKTWPPSFAAVALVLIVIAGAVTGVALIEHRAALAIVRPDDPPRPRTPSQGPAPMPCAFIDSALLCPNFDDTSPNRPAGPFPEVVENVEIVRYVAPQYPEAARLTGVRGTVRMNVGVRRDGSVGGVCVMAPLRCGLDRAAVAAVRQWQFRIPGRPRAVVVPVDVEFPPQ